MKVRGKILVAILSVTIASMLLCLAVLYHFSSRRLLSQIHDRLQAVAVSKASWITSYFQEKRANIDVLVKMPIIIDNLTRLEKAHEASGLDIGSFVRSEEYENIVKTMDAYLGNYKAQYGYYDIFVIDDFGNIVYTAVRESDFGTNILNGPYRGTSLGKAVKTAIESSRIAFADFEFYPPSDNAPAAFLANVIYDYDGIFHGVVALQLPIDKINEIMQQRTGLGQTGETYLVGPDYLMRSDSRFFEESTILKQKVDTKNARNSFAHEAEGTDHKWFEKIESFTDYRGVNVLGTHVYIPEVQWALLAEMGTKEALAPLRRLLLIFFAAGLGAMFVAYFISVWLTKKLTEPVAALRQAAAEIGKGNLDTEIKVRSNDEIGELADSFKTMAKDLSETTTSIDRLNREINERRRAERELQRFTSTVRHDIGNSVFSINAFSIRLSEVSGQIRDMLSRQKLDREVQQQLSTILADDIPTAVNYIRSSTAEIEALLAGLKRLAAYGRLELNIGTVDMNQLVNDIVGRMKPQLEQSDSSATVEHLENCVGDAGQIGQVFSNLLSNAIKYLDPNRKGQIRVSDSIDADNVIYAVQDNGTGITPEQQEKVFDAFYRGGNGRGVEGEGLGLTIAARVLDRHNGRIWCESEQGKGSTFYVELPKV